MIDMKWDENGIKQWMENGIKQWMKQSANDRYRRLVKQGQYKHNKVSEGKKKKTKRQDKYFKIKLKEIFLA